MIGLSPDATLYVLLYVLTFALHLALVGYVVAGTGWVAFAALRGRGEGRDTLAATYRDWLPFYLGAAITAGVAPLLFVQILYQERFYTANLLLSYRWLLLVPALVLGFYCLYLVKVRSTPSAGRRAVVAGSLVALGCFVFAAASWAENHLLSLDRGAWVGMYERGEHLYPRLAALPRLGIFAALAVVAAAAIGGMQTRDRDARRVAGTMGLAATFVAVAAVAIAALSMDRSPAQGPPVAAGGVHLALELGPLLLGGALLALEFAGWRRGSRGASRVPVPIGLLLVFVSVAWIREVARLRVPGVDEVSVDVARLGDSQGALLFAVFAALSTGILVALGRAVLRHVRASTSE